VLPANLIDDGFGVDGGRWSERPLRDLAQSHPLIPYMPILGQLASAQFPFNYGLEPGPFY